MSILFFTCANERYQDFAPLYAFSILAHIDDAIVEIGVENVESFHRMHHRAVAAIEKAFGSAKFRIRAVSWTLPDGTRILPNSVRFINQPLGQADYIYIGDVDVVVLDSDLVSKHLNHMAETKLPYSNAIRPQTRRMTGLHFAVMASHYPLPKIDDIDLRSTNDEVLLYSIVERKGLPIRQENFFRPVHGIHISPNRDAKSTINESGKSVPGWGIERYREAWGDLSKTNNFCRLRSFLSPRVQSCLAIIDDVAEQS